MALATWWQGDPLPELTPLPQFTAVLTADVPLLARMAHLPTSEVQARIDARNRPFIGYIGQEPAGYGWIAQDEGVVVEAGLRFPLAERDCYLWDFATLPEWRGHGVYPHLLQAIVRHELTLFDRFWILYAPFNHASQSGIHKAGFQSVLDFERGQSPTGTIKGKPLIEGTKASTGAAVLRVPLVSNTVCAHMQQ